MAYLVPECCYACPCVCRDQVRMLLDGLANLGAQYVRVDTQQLASALNLHLKLLHRNLQIKEYFIRREAGRALARVVAYPFEKRGEPIAISRNLYS